MIKLFEEFDLLDQDIEFGDIVEIRGSIKNHHKGEKAIVLSLEYNEIYGHAYYRIEFADRSQKLCKEPLLYKRSKKTYDDVKFLTMMKKRKSYLSRVNKDDDDFLYSREREKKEQERREKKRKEKEKRREEIRLKMLDVDPYGEEDWGEFNDGDDELDWVEFNDGDDELDNRFGLYRLR